MALWVWVTVLAAVSQSIRTAQQKRLKTRIGDLGASYVRFSYAIPFAWVWLLGYASWDETSLPALNNGFLFWVSIGAVLQIILNYYEFGLSAEESVYLHRYHHQWKPETLMYEDFDDSLISELIDLGFTLKRRPPDYDYSNGITSSIMIENGKLIGVSDPRSDDYMSIGISKNK